MNKEEIRNKCTVKNIMRILALFGIIFVFCPSFLVSCSGRDVNVNVMTAVKGVYMDGDPVVEPHRVMLLCVLIPILVLILLFTKKLSEQNTGKIILACVIVDLVMWIVFRISAKAIVEENMCEIKTTVWYFLNMIDLIGLAGMSGLLLAGKIHMDTNLWGLQSNQQADVVATFCTNCGRKIEKGSRFCTECGTPTQDEIIQNPGAEKTDLSDGVVNNRKNSISKKAIIAVVVAGVAILAIFFGMSRSASTINLNDYLIIQAEGYNGYGQVEASIDWAGIEEKYGDKLSFGSAAKAEYGGMLNLAGVTELMQDYISVSLDDTAYNASNGDQIAYTWNVDDELTSYVNCKVKYEDGTYEVQGLSEIGTFDAFQDVEVTFSGTAPNGVASLEYTGDELDYYAFSCDRTDGLSNGDVVTVTINESSIDKLASSLGEVPEVMQKEYTVSGLGSYITSASEISEGDMALLQQQAEDVFHAYVAQSWSDDVTLESLSYIGNYLLMPKADERYTHNQLYIVYKAQSHNQYSNSNGESYDAMIDVYWYAEFDDIEVDAQGKMVNDLTRYDTPHNTFQVDTMLRQEWLGTKKWTYYGYQTIDDIYKDVITSNLGEYNYEDNVDASKAASVDANK